MARSLPELLKVASEAIAEKDAELAALTEKVARFERKEIAEEIAQTKIALNVISHDGFLDEVATLLDSDEDLSQIKLALRHGGARNSPNGFTVVDGASPEDKTASKPGGTQKKAHVVKAQQEWEAAKAKLSGDDPDA